MLDKVQSAVDAIQAIVNKKPLVGIVLGSGLGGLVDKITNIQAIKYKDIPNFPLSTVEGHNGQLIFGELGGKSVVAMQGRFHYYEGYSTKEVTFPIRVMKDLGIVTLFVSNASGALNPNFKIGDLMLISDHINLIPNPLIGKNDNRVGPRFPDMSTTYTPSLITLAENIAKENNIGLQKGVYVGTTGPTFETPAEYKYFRIIGGDAVGMSTCPEVIVARHAGLPVFGISIITDLGVEGKIVEVSHEDVQREAAKAQKIMTILIEEMLRRI